MIYLNGQPVRYTRILSHAATLLGVGKYDWRKFTLARVEDEVVVETYQPDQRVWLTPGLEFVALEND